MVPKWREVPAATDGTAKSFLIETKDEAFENPSQRKKIYKVYVTYKCSASSYIAAYYAKNGQGKADGTNWTQFSDDSTRYAASTGFTNTSSVWERAELKFTSSSDVNNIYSFQLRLINVGTTAAVADFEINDIEIIYRKKNVR